MAKSTNRGYPPQTSGSLEISVGNGRKGIFIGGDPQGLRSLAEVLHWLADTDQESNRNLPDGERDHTHLHPGQQLTMHSEDTELCRLDAKGSGEFPAYYKRTK